MHKSSSENYISSRQSFSSPLGLGLDAAEAAARGANSADITDFNDFPNVPSWLIENCRRIGYTEPTIVQQKAIPVILEGKDVVLQAQTGSGKTVAYALPVLSRIDTSRSAIQAVIVVPTRELGLQVTSVLKQLSQNSGFAPGQRKIMIMSVVEGSNNRRQLLWATAEPPHIVVGNPRSLLRLVDMGRLRLNAVSFVVLDEVDACLIKPETRQELHRLLSRNLSKTYTSVALELDDSEESAAAGAGLKSSLVFKNLAKGDRSLSNAFSQDAAAGGMDAGAATGTYRIGRQTIMCSATIPQRQHFAITCFKNGWTETVPDLLHISAEELVPPQIQHEYVPLPLDADAKLRLSCVAYLVRSEMKTVLEEIRGDSSGGGRESTEVKAARPSLLKRSARSKTSSDIFSSPLSDPEDLVPASDGNYIDDTAGTTSGSDGGGRFRAIIFVPSSGGAAGEDADDAVIRCQKALLKIMRGMGALDLSMLVNNRQDTQEFDVDSIIDTDENSDGPNKGIAAEEGIEKDDSELRSKPSPSRISSSSQSLSPEFPVNRLVGRLSDRMSLNDRAQALEDFRKGLSLVLVCSELAARGIDVPATTHVIQFTLPTSTDEYLHRAGRTGRLNRAGKVITLTNVAEGFVVQRYMNELGIEIRKRSLRIAS